MALDSYTALSTAIGTWGTRTYATSQTDEFILIFESMANQWLGPQYRREVITTLTTDENGEASLPSGFVGMRSLVRDYAGAKPLLPVPWATLISLNAYAESGSPLNYAINGTTLKVAPIAEDDFTAVHQSKLAGLTSNNSSNWLLVEAPHAYLFGCRAAQAAFEEEFQSAALFEGRAKEAVEGLVAQSVVAQYANAEMVIEGPTP